MYSRVGDRSGRIGARRGVANGLADVCLFFNVLFSICRYTFSSCVFWNGLPAVFLKTFMSWTGWSFFQEDNSKDDVAGLQQAGPGGVGDRKPGRG